MQLYFSASRWEMIVFFFYLQRDTHVRTRRKERNTPAWTKGLNSRSTVTAERPIPVSWTSKQSWLRSALRQQHRLTFPLVVN